MGRTVLTGMLRIYYIICIMVSFLLVSASTGLYAQWQTSGPRYSYEDYRDARIAIESNNRSDSDVREAKKSSDQQRKNVINKQKLKTGPQKKTGSAVKNNKSVKSNYKKYTVRKGDTLLKIARKFNTSYNEICRANSLKDKDVIYAGMMLKIPIHGEKKASLKKGAEASAGKSPYFRWPLKCVLSFKRDGGKDVRPIGIIIKSRSNEQVYPAASGVVKKVGEMRGFGKYIMVNHRDRYMTVYSNLKNISVTAGDRVRVSSNIGTVSDDDILHFQIDHAGKPQNPLNFLPKKG